MEWLQWKDFNALPCRSSGEHEHDGSGFLGTILRPIPGDLKHSQHLAIWTQLSPPELERVLLACPAQVANLHNITQKVMDLKWCSAGIANLNCWLGHCRSSTHR